jgi:hypothetical protein
LGSGSANGVWRQPISRLGAMGNVRRITYRLRADAAPESESTTLANVYEFLLDFHRKKEAAEPCKPGDLNDAKGSKHDSRQREYT